MNPVTRSAAVPAETGLLEHWLMHYARRFPIRRGKLRVIDALWRFAARDRGQSRIARLAHGGFRMQCNLDLMVQRQYYFFGTYFLEQEHLRCWEQQARSANVVFDIGANAGIYSLSALSANRSAQVHAFEPTPELATHIRDTAALNALSNLHVHEVAIARAAGRACLWRCSGESGTNEGMNFITTNRKGSGEEVPTISIDRFCAEHAIDRVDLMKIDIQGNEPEALAGAQAMLGEQRIGTIFIELNWESGVDDSPAARTVAMLDGAGYRFARPGPTLEWRAAGDWLRAESDVVAARG